MSEPNRAPSPVDMVLCGRVVTMDGERREIVNGAIAVADGMIRAVGARGDVLAAHPAQRLVDDADAILLPGFTDCHTHSTQSLVRGLIAGELPMIYRLYLPADMILTPAEARIGAMLCASQLAMSGVTSVCDFATNTSPEHEDAIIDGLLSVGLRCTFLRGNGDQKGHHAALYSQIRDRSSLHVRAGEAERDLRRTEELLKRAAADPTGLFCAGVCPSGLVGFSSDYVQAAHALAARYDTTLQIHAARDREEVEFSLACFGRRPIEHLADLGVVDHRLVVVHGLLATEREIALLGNGGAGLAHSAAECLNLLSKVPPIPRMRAAGMTVGLGCDNAVNDMFAVMQAARTLQVGTQGIATYEPDCVSEYDILAMATCDAARLMRQSNARGSIEVGKAADIVVLDGSRPHMFPLQDAVPDIVRFGARDIVSHVLVNGHMIVEKGALVHVDMPALRSQAVAIGAKLKAEIAPRRYTSLCCP